MRGRNSSIPRPLHWKPRRGNLALDRSGLIPSWAKDPSIGHKMINARAETAAVKPSFKRPLHERMPVILRKEDEVLWLDPKAKAGDVAALLVPFDDDALEAYEVSRLINSPANDTPAVAQAGPAK